jgi:hypothetical protein
MKKNDNQPTMFVIFSRTREQRNYKAIDASFFHNRELREVQVNEAFVWFSSETRDKIFNRLAMSFRVIDKLLQWLHFFFNFFEASSILRSQSLKN